MRFLKIGHVQPCRIQFVSGPHDGDKRYAGFRRFPDDLDLAAHGIYGVHDAVPDRKIKRISRFRKEKSLAFPHGALRCDVADAFFGEIHLVFSHRRMKGEDLTVQVAQADAVVIDQINCTDPASGESFRSIAAYAAESEDGDAAVLKTRKTVRAQKHFGS